MLSILLTVWLLHLAVLVTPGANVLLVSQLAASDRYKSAVLAALGVSVGAGMWATLAVFGVNAVFEAFPRLRLALQVLAGIYLLYVATRIWRSGGSGEQAENSSLSAWPAFRLGLLTIATNPKAALFFGSVFTASFPSEPSAWLQSFAVAMVFLNALCWHLFLAFMFSRAGIRVGYARNRAFINRVAAALLGAIGCRILAASAVDMKS